MSTHHIFEIFIALHITAGAPGLLTFWVAVGSKKGGNIHKFWGKFFAFSMLFTATMAICMSLMSLAAPMTTHPHLVHHEVFEDPAMIRGIFGWMMLYLAILTINLTWYGWRCIKNRNNHLANRGPVNVGLQVILLIASINCAAQGLLIGQLMMVGMSTIGFATVGTNWWFIRKDQPSPIDWLLEHIKGIVGTGISVYTAFFAFGAVRLLPEAALSPALWAAPLIVGLAIIFYHREKIRRRMPSGRKRAVMS